MSSRRQARAGQTPATARQGGVPVELTSRLHPCWENPAAVARLAAAHGLVLTVYNHGTLKDAPWWARFDAFRRAWIEAHGLMSNRYPGCIDWRRADEAGLDMSSSSRYRLRGTTDPHTPKEMTTWPS